MTTPRLSRRRWAIVAAAAAVMAAAVLWVWRPGGPGPGGDPAALAPEAAADFVRGVSLLENLRGEEASPIFERLSAGNAGRAAALQNRAIAALVVIDGLNGRIALAETPAAEKTAMRSRLPGLFAEANESIAAAMEREADNVELARLAVIAEEQRIAQLPDVMQGSLKADLFDRILGYLETFPGDPVLAAKAYNIALGLSRTNPAVFERVGPVLTAAYEQNPRNAYLLKSLISQRIETQDPKLAELVDPALEMAAPQAWFMDMQVGGTDASAPLREASASGDLDLLRAAFGGWVNVFTATTILQNDADRTEEVSPLEFVRLDAAHRSIARRDAETPGAAAGEVAVDDLPVRRAPLEWVGRTAFGPDAELLEVWDWNNDLRPELLTAAGTTLTLLTPELSEADKAETLAQIDVEARALCLAVVDLFEVQNPARAFLPREGTAATDFRHETLRDVVVGTEQGVALVSLQVDGVELKGFKIVDAAATGLPAEGRVTAVLPLDVESDGDLDLLMAVDGRLRIYENRGARNFRDASADSLLPPPEYAVTAMVACDMDRDVDTDVLIAFETGVGRLENILHGQFAYHDQVEGWGPLAGSTELAVAELDGNISWDFVGLKSDRVVVAYTATVPGAPPRIRGVDQFVAEELSAIEVADMDNSGTVDILLAGEGGVRVLWNTPEPATLWQVQGTAFGAPAASVDAADLDRDGRLEVVVAGGTSAVHVLSSKRFAGEGNRYAAVRVKGISDVNGGGRVNEYAIGTTLELYSVDSYQAQVIQDSQTHFGLGRGTPPYSLRIIFPNGLTQTVIDPPVDTLIEEKQVLKGSCPFLYGWDGKRWQMVTDCLWNAPLGLQVSRGQVLPGRRWEYLMLPRSLMQPKDGGYELRLTEELWEAAYFDQVELLAVDHPASMSVLSNEKVGPGSLAEPGVWTFERMHPSPRIVDSSGRDWTEALSKTDETYAIAFDQYVCQGVVSPHHVDIALPEGLPRDNIQLVLHGWLHPTDTSLNVGISQDAGRAGPKPPELSVVDAQGEVRLIRDFMGFPGGKPKTIVVDLAGQLKEGDAAVRIATSAELYWDQAYFIAGRMLGLDAAKPLRLESADLRYRGFSALVQRRRHEPHMYDYSSVETMPQWVPLKGLFTRLGDCRSIIAADDDSMVVMGAGDELAVRWAMPADDVAEGYVRDFLLHNIGWDKDADLNTLTGQSSLPLPFAAMKQYPPGPGDAQGARRVEQLNAETLTRRQSQQAFWRDAVLQQ